MPLDPRVHVDGLAPLDEDARTLEGDGHRQRSGGFDECSSDWEVRARPRYGGVPLSGARGKPPIGVCRVNYAAGEYIAFTSTGGIRAGLGKGPIDSAMITAVVPFKNQMRFASVNGTIIKLMLEHGVSDVSGAAGRFPAIHGLGFEYDPARPAGSRVTRVEVPSPGPTVAEPRRWGVFIPSDDGGLYRERDQVWRYPSNERIPLVAEKEYLLVTLDFLLGGGDVSATVTPCRADRSGLALDRNAVGRGTRC